MIEKIKLWILSHNHIKKVVLLIYNFYHEIYISHFYKKKLLDRNPNMPVVYYLGIPAHRNLGDLAQGVCIRSWIKEFYVNYQIIELETDALVNTHFSLLNLLKEQYEDRDIILFQSGYTTTDLGGYADEMHRAVISALPDAKFLMMPQTIYFQHKDNELRTSQIYNRAKNMLFLARDEVSYKQALDMFPSIRVKLFPDIVTTLIGKYNFKHEREGILFCCRNDSEKYYKDEKIEALISQCSLLEPVSKTDTTKTVNKKDIICNAKKYMEQEIDAYSHYKIIITDRYHGTIFSLVAGTPVIILQTLDHKVVTGKKWFDGIYDDYIYLAKDLEDAYAKAKFILGKTFTHQLPNYFQGKYYDNLKIYFEDMLKETK